MKTLALYAVEAIDHLVQPADFDDTTLSSPALSVVTDFKHSQPNMISATSSARDALEMMLVISALLTRTLSAPVRVSVEPSRQRATVGSVQCKIPGIPVPVGR